MSGYSRCEIRIRFNQADKYWATIPFSHYEQAIEAFYKIEKEQKFYAMSLIVIETKETILHRSVRNNDGDVTEYKVEWTENNQEDING